MALLKPFPLLLENIPGAFYKDIPKIVLSELYY
jgi:hypothetical protein